MTESQHVVNRINFGESNEDTLLILLGGDWKTNNGFQDTSSVETELTKKGRVKEICFQTRDLRSWDTSLIAFLIRCEGLCRRKKIFFDISNLPEDIKQLLYFSSRRVEMGALEAPVKTSLLEAFGEDAIHFACGFRDVLKFLGELSLSLARIVSGKAHTRWRDFVVLVQEVGAEALPIVTLISFLVGFIMAFIGFTQLKRFGATIYVADLVGIAMVREMGVMMTGVIMCGRTGAAFAATLGSMKIGEEIDALRTTGISPFDFLVTPRVLALLVMMPILTIYADFIGVFGGLLVTSSFSEITFTEYWQETQAALTMKHISVGMYKSFVFGTLIALTGCLRGMQCGSSSSAVGDATTSAVVTGITSLIVADAIFAVLFDALDI